MADGPVPISFAPAMVLTMVAFCNQSAFGSSLDGVVSVPHEPASDALRAIRAGKARLCLKASDALTFLLAGRAESLIWAGQPLTWQRGLVMATLNAGALLALATCGLAVWAFTWWALLVIPAFCAMYLLWSQCGHVVRLASGATLLALGIIAAITFRSFGPGFIWLIGVAVTCLLLQFTHYLAYYHLRSVILASDAALEGLQRRGIVRVVLINQPN